MGEPGWFAGCFSPDTVLAIVPSGARVVFDGERRLWANHAPRVVTAAGWRIALMGVCAAPTSRLERLLENIAGGRENIEALIGLGGSYHVIVDDGRALTVIGDLAGLRQVFTAQLDGLTMFASSPHLLAPIRRGTVNGAWLAAKLFCQDAVELHENATAFNGVMRVPPGWLLECGPRGALVVRRADPTPDGRDMVEAARVLGEALEAAVATRTRQPVSADLSGGLDSTPLTLLAAHHGPVTAVTYVDPLASGDEDVVFAEKAATLRSGISHVVVNGNAQTLPYAALDIALATMLDEPSQDLLIAARTRARLAPGVGGGTHLAGDGGDVVLAGPLTYLADLVRARRYGALAREATAWARLRQRPATALVSCALRCARSTYTSTLSRCALCFDALALGERRVWHRPGVEANLTWCRPSAAASWATATAARTLADRLHALADQQPHDLGADQMALRAVRWHGAVTRGTQRLAASWGVPFHAPFLDDTVIAACAALPVVERTTAIAAKPLLRRALRGRVPDEALTRRSKGDYTASEYAGLRAAAPQLRALLTNPVLADLDLIEPRRVLAALQGAVDGRPAPLGALADVIATELWLRAQARDTTPARSITPGGSP